MCFNVVEGICVVVLVDMGLVIVFDWMFVFELVVGSVVCVLEKWVLLDIVLWVVFFMSRLVSVKVCVFVDFVEEIML